MRDLLNSEHCILLMKANKNDFKFSFLHLVFNPFYLN